MNIDEIKFLLAVLFLAINRFVKLQKNYYTSQKENEAFLKRGFSYIFKEIPYI